MRGLNDQQKVCEDGTKLRAATNREDAWHMPAGQEMSRQVGRHCAPVAREQDVFVRFTPAQHIGIESPFRRDIRLADQMNGQTRMTPKELHTVLGGNVLVQEQPPDH